MRRNGQDGARWGSKEPTKALAIVVSAYACLTVWTARSSQRMCACACACGLPLVYHSSDANRGSVLQDTPGQGVRAGQHCVGLKCEILFFNKARGGAVRGEKENGLPRTFALLDASGRTVAF